MDFCGEFFIIERSVYDSFVREVHELVHEIENLNEHVRNALNDSLVVISDSFLVENDVVLLNQEVFMDVSKFHRNCEVIWESIHENNDVLLVDPNFKRSYCAAALLHALSIVPVILINFNLILNQQTHKLNQVVKAQFKLAGSLDLIYSVIDKGILIGDPFQSCHTALQSLLDHPLQLLHELTPCYFNNLCHTSLKLTSENINSYSENDDLATNQIESGAYNNMMPLCDLNRMRKLIEALQVERSLNIPALSDSVSEEEASSSLNLGSTKLSSYDNPYDSLSNPLLLQRSSDQNALSKRQKLSDRLILSPIRNPVTRSPQRTDHVMVLHDVSDELESLEKLYKDSETLYGISYKRTAESTALKQQTHFSLGCNSSAELKNNGNLYNHAIKGNNFNNTLLQNNQFHSQSSLFDDEMENQKNNTNELNKFPYDDDDDGVVSHQSSSRLKTTLSSLSKLLPPPVHNEANSCSHNSNNSNSNLFSSNKQQNFDQLPLSVLTTTSIMTANFVEKVSNDPLSVLSSPTPLKNQEQKTHKPLQTPSLFLLSSSSSSPEKTNTLKVSTLMSARQKLFPFSSLCDNTKSSSLMNNKLADSTKYDSTISSCSSNFTSGHSSSIVAPNCSLLDKDESACCTSLKWDLDEKMIIEKWNYFMLHNKKKRKMEDDLFEKSQSFQPTSEQKKESQAYSTNEKVQNTASFESLVNNPEVKEEGSEEDDVISVIAVSCKSSSVHEQSEPHNQHHPENEEENCPFNSSSPPPSNQFTENKKSCLSILQSFDWVSFCEASNIYPPATNRNSQNEEEFSSVSCSAVLIKGLVDEGVWPCISKWREIDKFWFKKHGRRCVPVEKTLNYLDMKEKNEHDKTKNNNMFEMTHIYSFLRDALLNKECMYLAQHDIFSQIPSLLIDIPEPFVLSAMADPNFDIERSIWIGPQNTFSPWHVDPRHNLFCQVAGVKHFKVCDPNLLPKQLINSTNEQEVREFLDSSEGSELVSDVVLGPGDALYLPRKWWHSVKGLSASISVSHWFDLDGERETL
eukprot:GDKJ01038777.1.p1 GENE.GDKJ01038777.1~~GDKJ01038777.1.p1  ORF type:complete len:1040 (+),score=232.20 GDKJ01038777.1:39-3122(+)